jgi:hypothetical protein
MRFKAFWCIFVSLYLCTILCTNVENYLSVLSPHNGETLLTHMVLVLVHLPHPNFQLEPAQCQLCLNINEIDSRFCWDQYSMSRIPVWNRTFAQYISVSPNLLSPTTFQAAISLRCAARENIAALDSSISLEFTVVSPFASLKKDNEDGSTKGDGTQKTAGNGSTTIVADFTFANANSLDIMQMRYQEHIPDLLILVDSNQAHSDWAPKTFLFDNCSLHSQSDSKMVSQTVEYEHVVKLLGVSFECFSAVTGLNTGPQTIKSTGNNDSGINVGKRKWGGHSIVAVNPPSIQDVSQREPLQRSFLGAVHAALREQQQQEEAQVIEHNTKEEQLPKDVSGNTKKSKFNVADLYIVSDTDEIIHRTAVRSLRVRKLRATQNYEFCDNYILFAFNFILA